MPASGPIMMSTLALNVLGLFDATRWVQLTGRGKVQSKRLQWANVPAAPPHAPGPRSSRAAALAATQVEVGAQSSYTEVFSTFWGVFFCLSVLWFLFCFFQHVKYRNIDFKNGGGFAMAGEIYICIYINAKSNVRTEQSFIILHDGLTL